MSLHHGVSCASLARYFADLVCLPFALLAISFHSSLTSLAREVSRQALRWLVLIVEHEDAAVFQLFASFLFFAGVIALMKPCGPIPTSPRRQADSCRSSVFGWPRFVSIPAAFCQQDVRVASIPLFDV